MKNILDKELHMKKKKLEGSINDLTEQVKWI